MMTTRAELADRLFPDTEQTIQELLALYPVRANSNPVLRFAPSPTGFLHFGGLYTSFLCWKYAKQTGGTIYLRIEDTDQKREVEGATALLIQSLKKFGISFDEGPIGENNEEI